MASGLSSSSRLEVGKGPVVAGGLARQLANLARNDGALLFVNRIVVDPNVGQILAVDLEQVGLDPIAELCRQVDLEISEINRRGVVGLGGANVIGGRSARGRSLPSSCRSRIRPGRYRHSWRSTDPSVPSRWGSGNICGFLRVDQVPLGQVSLRARNEGGAGGAESRKRPSAQAHVFAVGRIVVMRRNRRHARPCSRH